MANMTSSNPSVAVLSAFGFTRNNLWKRVFTVGLIVWTALLFADADRIRRIDPVNPGCLRLRPTFCSCGVYYGAESPMDGLTLEYRVTGSGSWSRVELPYFAETKDCRGSILRLAENTEYEVRVNGSSSSFRTWSSQVPVARTIVVDPARAHFPIRISDVGTPEGWVRYTVAKGVALRCDSSDPIFIVDGATNVLIEGISFAGTKGKHAMTIERSSDVRVVNCEFSHWGRESRVYYEGLGRPYEPGFPPTGIEKNQYGGFSPKGGKRVNCDGAILIGEGSSKVVVERSWFHDCTINANAWYYSHPAGGEGIVLGNPDHSTVIRWCDFTGSDLHRWNDAIESQSNFSEVGGFNRDADVYGNFIIYAADDGIELDGGQQNVRCFDNRFESALCGVSVQGCMVSPSYVFDNGFFGMCDRFGDYGQTVKTGGGPHGEGARTYISGNLFWGPGFGFLLRTRLQAELKDNVFCGAQRIGEKESSPGSVRKDNRFHESIPETELPTTIPVRPAGFVLDRARFGGIMLQKGVLSPAALSVKARATGERDVAFAVAINDDMPWLRVSPASGVIPAGGEVPLNIVLDAAQMTDRHDYRGVFLVRTAEGLSRPVSVYVETDFVPPAHPEQPGDIAVYADSVETVDLARDAGVKEYAFVVPKDGRYYFHFHASAQGLPRGLGGIDAALDDGPFERSQSRVWKYPVWAPVAPGNKFGNALRFWDFKAGERHVLKIRAAGSPIVYDGVVMTDNPGSFEPR